MGPTLPWVLLVFILAAVIASLHAGDFFGEMGMMTGAPRSATVIALGDVECYRVDKDAFHDILRGRPQSPKTFRKCWRDAPQS